MAEELTKYLTRFGVRCRYIHSDVDTLERVEIMRDLRLGLFDVLIGVNLLREGLDLPEVSLVAIMDADKEGFLRSERSLVQTIGRAARNINGLAIMYAEKITDSMKDTIEETDRRRSRQAAYNKENGIAPQALKKSKEQILAQTTAASGKKAYEEPQWQDMQAAEKPWTTRTRKAWKRPSRRPARKWRKRPKPWISFWQLPCVTDCLNSSPKEVQFAADSIAQQLPVHLCLADECPAFLQVVMKDAVPFNDRHLLAILIDQSRQEWRRLPSGKMKSLSSREQFDGEDLFHIVEKWQQSRGCIGAHGDMVFLVLGARNAIH